MIDEYLAMLKEELVPALGCEGVDETIKSICRVAREGMKITDLEILKIMIEL